MQWLVNSYKHHQVFLCIALIWGIMMVFLTPPFMVPDEPAHFYRAYQISEMQFIPDVEQNRLGGDLPFSLELFQNRVQQYNGLKIDKQLFGDLISIQLEPEKKAFLFFPNTSLYTPVPYIPQSIGIGIGRIFHAPPIILLYLARLFNLFFWIFLLYQSIRMIPFYKNLIFVLALLPMSVFQAASVSADVLLNGLSFFLLAFVFKWYAEKDALIGYKEIIFFLILAVTITWSKSIYFLLMGLLLVIPKSKFREKPGYWFGAVMIFLTTIVAFISNYSILQFLLNQIHPIENIYGLNGLAPRINPDLQIEGILSDKSAFVLLIIRSLWWYKIMLLQSYIGILGWMDVVLNNYYYLWAYISILVLAIFDNKYDIRLNVYIKILLIFIAISILLLFSITMYSSWNNVGDPMIDNWQGRYFIPIAPLVLFLFSNQIKYHWTRYLHTYAILFIMGSIIVSTISLLNAYYF